MVGRSPTKSDLKSEYKLGSSGRLEKTKKTDETREKVESTVRTKITELN